MMSPSGEPSTQPDRTNAPITAAFDQQVRPFIDLIDTLRQYGLDEDVDLPAVAVIGDQSSGKSSTLEAISGIQLPRGSGIVTRCPLVLRLKSTVSDGKEWSGRIQYKYKDDGAFRECNDDIDDPEEVGEKVKLAQDRIAGTDKGIKDELITLEIESPDVPDLTLIDLPGITRIALEGQPHDIPDQIKRMIRNRIQSQETIILSVVPANIDIATTEAIQMAQQFDPEGVRTLGVITKPDLIDPGTGGDLVAIVTNQKLPLKKGYTVVKCRGQQNISEGQSLVDALQSEEAFFEDTPHFQEVDKSLLGVKNLSIKLSDELVEAIKRCLPKLKEEVIQKLDDTREELEQLGQGLPVEDRDKRYMLIKMLTEFGERVCEVCSGDYSKVRTERHHLFTQSREFYKTLLDRIAANTPGTTSSFPTSVSAPSNIVSLGSQPRKPTPTLSGGFSFGTPTVQASTAPVFSPSTSSHTLLTERNQQFIDKIMKAMELHRGDELPRFMNYKVCRMLINEVIDRYITHANKCLSSVDKLVETVIGEIAQQKFMKFTKLCGEIKLRITKLRSAARDTCKQRIGEIFEMEKMVFTQDRIFNHDLDIEIEQKRQRGDWIVTMNLGGKKVSGDQDEDKAMLQKLSRGHQIASASMADLGEYEVKRQQAEDMYTMMKAYLEVSTRRMVDTIPLTIQLHLIRKLSEEIKFSAIALAMEPAVLAMVYEDPRTENKRKACQAKLERLEIADEELSKFA